MKDASGSGRSLRGIYLRASLAQKIRVSYLLLLVPVLMLLFVALYNLWYSNRQYESMINSVGEASAFSLDFQKDYDYETYLLIVGNKTPEDSGLTGMIADARSVIDSLEDLTDGEDNRRRLLSVRKYLHNLESYQKSIEDNLREGSRYEDNIEIWENDVQIVTSLIRESVFEYIYYEIRDLQESRARYQASYRALFRGMVLVLLLASVLIMVLSVILPRSITRPIRELKEVTDQVAGGDLTVRSEVRTSDEVGSLSRSLNSMIEEINGLLKQVTTEQIRLRKAEFQLLQSQINPHFLYNTLDAIVWLAESGMKEQVVKMVGSLSEFFRATLNQGKDIVTLEEELQHIRSYLEIQQIRYEDILRYRIEVPASILQTGIPKITLQPLVENALYHGIKNRRGGGEITVTGRKEGDGILLLIEDNGIGMSRERLRQVNEALLAGGLATRESDVYGIYNVNERIRLNFGSDYGLTLTSEEGKGTRVTIRLPEESQPNS